MKLSQIAARVGALFDAAPLAQGAAMASTAVLLALTPAAHAVVVTTTLNIPVPATTQGIYINVVTGVFANTPAGAAGWDINPWGSGSLFVYGTTGGAIVSSANSPVAALALGAVVSAASAFGAAGSGGVATFGALAGQWTLNATNYFGFSFIGDDTLLHYGYGTMIVGTTALVRTVGIVRYESLANTAITAVPEPSSWALLMAGGVGVAGAAARRRRRQAAA